MSKDYYAILSVSQQATRQQIKQRFLELARSRHPDLYDGEEKLKAESEFQDITEAFNVLSNPTRRRQHDAELSSPTPVNMAADPKTTVRTFMSRAVRAYREGRYREAAEDFERATAVDPENSQAWYHLALACGREQRLRSKAMSAIAKACELDKMNASYLKLAGRLFAEGGMPLRAEKYYRRALKWAKDDVELHDALASLKSR